MEFPRDPAVGVLMARIKELIEQGRPRAARPLLAAARGLAPPSSDMSVLAARLALCEGTLDSAAAELDAAVRAEPEHLGLRKCRAELRRRIGDLEGATHDAAEAVMLDRDDPAAKATLGELLLQLGRTGDAVACLIEAVAAEPKNIAFRETLARALTTSGDMSAALAALLDGIRIVPEATATRNAAIVLCIRRGDLAQAEALAEQARIDGVADANTYGLTGHVLSALNRHDQATLAYREALKLAPGDTHLRQLAAAVESAPDDYVRTLFEGFADRFESHIIELGYRIPGLIRRHVIDFLTVADIGPVLDLGCGTGLVALALSDLRLGPFTGIDVSPQMLERARIKGLYATLREGRLPAALHNDNALWQLILAADLMCYFGDLEEILGAVRDRLCPGGRFIFSVEELAVGHDGSWAPVRLGRYVHAAGYINATADAVGFRRLALERDTLRYEAGGPVPGLIVVLQRQGNDA